jgi:Fe-S-cluster containining protein
MTIQFEHPPELAFTCTRCGDCCRSGNIMLGPGEEQQLRALDWSGREADLEKTETVVSTPLPGGRRVLRLARRDDGCCVYLGADQRCRIHSHFGGERKPLMCRLYPFGFYPVGGRVTVDCAFSCRSISEGSGDPIAKRVEEWTALLGERAAAPEKRRRLTRHLELSGELLWEIEHYLLGLLANQGLTLFDRVRCCLQFTRLATTGDPASPAAAKLREAIARGLPRQISKIPRGGHMDPTQRAVFYQWLCLALNPPPVNADLSPSPNTRRKEEMRAAAAQRFTTQKGAPNVDNRELPADFKQIAQVDAMLVTAPSSPLLERFLAAKIIGQRFLLGGDEELPLVEAVPLFFLSYPMAIWTARALAAERGAAAVSEPDLRRALGLLDRSLGQVSLAALPAKSREVWHFIVEETDLAVEATNELAGWPVEESGLP